jgi:hypothetical protein
MSVEHDHVTFGYICEWQAALLHPFRSVAVFYTCLLNIFWFRVIRDEFYACLVCVFPLIEEIRHCFALDTRFFKRTC